MHGDQSSWSYTPAPDVPVAVYSGQAAHGIVKSEPTAYTHSLAGALDATHGQMQKIQPEMYAQHQPSYEEQQQWTYAASGYPHSQTQTHGAEDAAVAAAMVMDVNSEGARIPASGPAYSHSADQSRGAPAPARHGQSAPAANPPASAAGELKPYSSRTLHVLLTFGANFCF